MDQFDPASTVPNNRTSKKLTAVMSGPSLLTSRESFGGSKIGRDIDAGAFEINALKKKKEDKLL